MEGDVLVMLDMCIHLVEGSEAVEAALAGV